MQLWENFGLGQPVCSSQLMFGHEDLMFSRQFFSSSFFYFVMYFEMLNLIYGNKMQIAVAVNFILKLLYVVVNCGYLLLFFKPEG